MRQNGTFHTILRTRDKPIQGLSFGVEEVRGTHVASYDRLISVPCTERQRRGLGTKTLSVGWKRSCRPCALTDTLLPVITAHTEAEVPVRVRGESNPV